MSVLVMSLCFRAIFGCPKRKALAIALADHARDDGTSVYPSIRHLVNKTEWGERTVQRTLRDLEGLGVLVCIDAGGKGPKDTREYAFNMPKLSAMAAGSDVVKGVRQAPIEDDKGDQQTPIKGVCETPIDELRVSNSQLRVSTGTNKGVHQTPEPSLNHRETSLARERARAGGRALDAPREVKRSEGISPRGASATAVPYRTLRARDAAWSAWLSHIEAEGTAEMRRAAVQAGEIGVPVGGSWPKPGGPLPRIPGYAVRGKQHAAGGN